MLLLAIGMIAVAALWFLFRIRPRRRKESGFRYVYVNNDGSARELDEDEIEYLSTEFFGGDGNRPYIKLDYGERTPDGKLHGYLLRRRLPRRIQIEPVESKHR